MNDFNIKEHQATYYNIDKSQMRLFLNIISSLASVRQQ